MFHLKLNFERINGEKWIAHKWIHVDSGINAGLKKKRFTNLYYKCFCVQSMQKIMQLGILAETKKINRYVAEVFFCISS